MKATPEQYLKMTEREKDMYHMYQRIRLRNILYWYIYMGDYKMVWLNTQ